MEQTTTTRILEDKLATNLMIKSKERFAREQISFSYTLMIQMRVLV